VFDSNGVSAEIEAYRQERHNPELAPKTFPLHTLVGHYRSFNEKITATTQTDINGNAAAVLGSVSSVVGSRLWVRIHESWCYHSGLYVCLAAPASYGKGGIFEKLSHPIQTYETLARADFETLARADFETTRAGYRADAVLLKAEIEQLEKDLKNALRGDGNDRGEVAPGIAETIEEKQTEIRAHRQRIGNRGSVRVCNVTHLSLV